MASILNVDQIGHSTSGTTALTIDSSGNVTTGGRIDAGTSVYAQGSHSTTETGTITFNTNQVTSGGCSFEDSNTAMQVPVDGLYMVHYDALGNTGNGAFILQARKNGSAIPGSNTQNVANSNETLSKDVLIPLQADDKITFQVITGASHANASYNNFFVLKVG